MIKEIFLQKATRIEGNANIRIEIEDGSVKTARLLVHEFRGFEKFLQGRVVECVPQIISRICGVCSCAHQVASLKGIEDALGVRAPRSVHLLREVMVLGEWISSHALAFFFLSMPDLVGAGGGIFEILQKKPDLAAEGFALRKAGNRIVEILGKRATHPAFFGVGAFLPAPGTSELQELQTIASEIMERARRLLGSMAGQCANENGATIEFPADQRMNLLCYEDRSSREHFQVYDREGKLIARFGREEFPEHISEMRAEWSLAKFPYLTSQGFPEGILLVGPLARALQHDSVLDEPGLAGCDLVQSVWKKGKLRLANLDVYRFLEIYQAARRIRELAGQVDTSDLSVKGDLEMSGQGTGVIEAPRGTLVHKYTINRGRIERVRLLVATQFNNAWMNLLIRQVAEGHVCGDSITPEGERLIARCVRLFDPCLSCATH